MATRSISYGERREKDLEQRKAYFQPASFDPADNSVELVWTTGAAVRRRNFASGEIVEETLSLDPRHVRLDRLNKGAPLLVDHDMRVAAIAGSVVPGSVRLGNGRGTARVMLASSPDVADAL